MPNCPVLQDSCRIAKDFSCFVPRSRNEKSNALRAHVAKPCNCCFPFEALKGRYHGMGYGYRPFRAYRIGWIFAVGRCPTQGYYALSGLLYDFCLLRQHHAKAYMFGRIVAAGGAMTCHTAFFRSMVPAAAANRPVSTPFPDIAAHIVNS